MNILLVGLPCLSGAMRRESLVGARPTLLHGEIYSLTCPLLSGQDAEVWISILAYPKKKKKIYYVYSFSSISFRQNGLINFRNLCFPALVKFVIENINIQRLLSFYIPFIEPINSQEYITKWRFFTVHWTWLMVQRVNYLLQRNILLFIANLNSIILFAEFFFYL